MGGKTFTPQQFLWRWYADDGAEPTTALANEVVRPTLTNSNIIRLRLQITEMGGAAGSGAVTLQYSTDDVNFTAFGSSNHWNYANGQATEGNTIAANKLVGGLGKYHESGTVSESWLASQALEMDFAAQQTGTASAGTIYYFRALIAGVIVPLGSGQSHPQVTTAAAGWGMLLSDKRNRIIS